MRLNISELLALEYHDRFDYPMTKEELVKWEYGGKGPNSKKINAEYKDGFYFLKGGERIIKKRLFRERTSEEKLTIAQKTAGLLSKILFIKMVGITGSLAMKNADPGSDIDLVIITRKDCLWIARLISYFLLRVFGFELRKPEIKKEKNKLCLNLWLDESDLAWPKDNRYYYTAHEIAQIIPIVNKENTYEFFLWQNRWLLAYWPNSVKIQNKKFEIQKKESGFLLRFINLIAFYIQYLYMKNKITKEVVTLSRAIFHPRQLSS